MKNSYDDPSRAVFYCYCQVWGSPRDVGSKFADELSSDSCLLTIVRQPSFVSSDLELQKKIKASFGHYLVTG